MASHLSDEELREKLVKLGEDVGPLTQTTRPLWEKRLKTLQREKRRSPVRNINAFSSDDSEVDSGDVDVLHRKKRNNFRNASYSKYPGTSTTQVSPDGFKKPAIPRSLGNHQGFFSSTFTSKLTDGFSKLKKKRYSEVDSLGATYDISDSDLDPEAPAQAKLSSRLRNPSHVSDRNGDHRNYYYHRIKNNALPEKSDGFCRKAVKVPLPKTERLTGLSFAERWSLRNNFDRQHNKSSVNGYISTESVLNKEFPHAKVPGKTTNYSHCVSWMLVLGTAAFFILIGMVYMSEVQKVSQNLTKNSYLSLCCKESLQTKCIPHQYLKPALLISREVHSLLATVAGEYECATGTASSRHMDVSVIKSTLKAKIADQSIKEEEFDNIFPYVMWLIWKHPDWQIILHWDAESHEITAGDIKDFDHISALESVVAAKSFLCRIQHSMKWTATELSFLALVAAFVFIFFRTMKFLKWRRELQEKEMYELVEKIIDILQKQEEGCESTSPCSYKAVVHVRDMLMPLKERKSKQWLWDKAVNFIEENESRVRVEERHIAGESFKVWRWLSNSTAEGEGGRHGKVWQGQAFRNLGKGCPYGATPCLKIRNMFDPEVEYGDDWQICIQDAILEKCEGNNGIVHIAIDSTPSEGCVYLMCNSSEAAGKAFNALHGWWFDGKLVTVKYLRLERYLERFPDAQHCVEPLKPSNNERLSLSAPYFSSALERS